jgi:protein-L-isoaspartate(D-aspartate) O-methyltransferase
VSSFDFAAMRNAMVDSQLRTNAVTQPAVVAVLAAVPRELFVPPSQVARAYTDASIAVGSERRLNPPLATARLIAEAAIERHHKVLIIGAATGYACALVSRLAAEVVGVECDAALAETARSTTSAMPNVAIVEGDLAEGCSAQASFDIILIDGAVEQVPSALAMQLAEKGRIVAAIHENGVTRLVRGMRAGTGVSLVSFADVEAVPLPGFALDPVFSF